MLISNDGPGLMISLGRGIVPEMLPLDDFDVFAFEIFESLRLGKSFEVSEFHERQSAEESQERSSLHSHRVGQSI